LKTGRNALLGLLLCSLAFFCGHRADGQAELSQSAVSQSTAQVPVSSEGLIHLDVTATDAAGKFSTGLTAKDFTLLDNGVARKIVSFRPSEPAQNGQSNSADDENKRLTEVVLVLDEVNLAPVQVGSVKADAVRFLRENGGHLAYPVSIYWFTNGGLRASAAPSIDGNALAEEVAHNHSHREVWGIPSVQLQRMTTTSMYKLWNKSLETVYTIAIERRDKPGRKALVWMGVGWPPLRMLKSSDRNEAFASLVELSTRIREARLAIYQIPIWPDSDAVGFDYKEYEKGVGSLPKGEDPAPHFALPVLANQSGGRVVEKSESVVRAIGDCVQDASAFYTVSFDPPHAAQPDEYHGLKVQIATPELTARTNTGYYNQPVYYDQPRVPTKRVTVHELEQILDAAGAMHDRDLAEQLRGLELTERLSSGQLSLWENRLRGSRSKAALAVLGDHSVFLEPPAAEILPDAAPDHETQVAMLSKTVKYLDETLPQLPDFSATRVTVEYEQASPKEDDSWKTALADQSLREGATEKTILRYRNGEEQQDAQKKKALRGASGKDLNFKGIFGPILKSVLLDATTSGKLTWSRWERGESGRMAVFRYGLDRQNSHYGVVHCCLRHERVFHTWPAYHGELAVDPGTGAILRLTMESEPGWVLESNWQPVLPVKGTSMMVEYGPVEIGGRRYICPLRGVVTMRSRAVRTLIFWDETFEVYAPYETQLNDMAYTDYHKFGSDSRILPGFEVVPDTASPTAGSGPVQTKTPPDR
jgi:VWFA-related protein